MKKIDYFKQLNEIFKNPNNDSLNMSINDAHVEGLFSLVISGTEHGQLTRVFIADKKLNPYEVQLHTHRYPIKITSIKGDIKHYVATEVDCDLGTCQMSEFEYKSPLNGGDGLEYIKETKVMINDFSIPKGSSIKMGVDEFHTVSCSKGSIWIVEEQGFEVDSSRILGVPFVVDGLYNPPKQFQVNDKFQEVHREVKKILLDYQIVEL